MEETGIKESHVSCENSEGLQITGSIIHLNRHEIVFEIYSPTAVIQASEALKDFKVHLGGKVAYSGRAIIKSVVTTGAKAVCAAAIDDAWMMQFTSTDLEPGRMRELFKEYQQQWQKLHCIRPEYKLHIADMESFFADLRTWLDQVELGFRSVETAAARRVEERAIRELGTCILPSIDALFEKFEYLSNDLEPELRPAHRAYLQRRLHPLLLSAPIVHRTFTKPLGYAGDYEMVNMLARNSPEGNSLYSKIVHLWFVGQAPAAAHRNRLKFLTQRLVEETARVASEGRIARIYSVACGPAVEIQNFFREHELCNRAEFTLLDFNEETLHYITSELDQLKSRFSRRTPVHVVKRSVHHLLKESARATPKPGAPQYDFVYCAGLFDYLTDTVCQRLMTVLYDWVAPGGLLLATNVEPSNPKRQVMEQCVDWQLIYRTSRQAEGLRPTQVEPSEFMVRADLTGVNLMMEARKPHG